MENFPSGQRASGLTLPVVMILALVSSSMTRYPPVGERFFRIKSAALEQHDTGRTRPRTPVKITVPNDPIVQEALIDLAQI